MRDAMQSLFHSSAEDGRVMDSHRIDLRTRIASLELRHPVMNASGILGAYPEHIEILHGFGVSAVVTKTITLEPRQGYEPPIVLELEVGGLLNAVGLSNPGAEIVPKLCSKARELGVPIVVSVGGFSDEEFVVVASIADECGASAIELNLSCPHAPGTGIEIGSVPEHVKNLVKQVASVVKAPVIVKLGLCDRIVESAGKALEGGARGLTLINTVRAMHIDVYSFKPVLSNVFGGLSGPPIHPIAVRCVYEVYREYRCDIVGCGGVYDWRSAAELIVAGAKALQVGTMLAKRGRELVSEIVEGLMHWLRELGYRAIEEVVGAAQRA